MLSPPDVAVPQATRMQVDTGGSVTPASTAVAISAAPGAWPSTSATIPASAAGCAMPHTAISPRAPRRSISRPCIGRATPAATDRTPTTTPANVSDP